MRFQTTKTRREWSVYEIGRKPESEIIPKIVIETSIWGNPFYAVTLDFVGVAK